MSITNPSDVYCFSKQRTSTGYLMVMAVIPQHLFTRSNVDIIHAYFEKTVPHAHSEMVEISGPDHTRLHFYYEAISADNWTPNTLNIQTELRELIKPWEERLRDAIQSQFQGQLGQKLYTHYIQGFPGHHKVRRTPHETVRDILFLENVAHENTIQFDLINFTSEQSTLAGKASQLSIYNRDKIDLINIMPILQNLGLYVFDELTTRVGTPSTLYGYIHSFRVAHVSGEKIDEKRYKTVLTTLLSKVFQGETENDPLNGLALAAELDWRAINLFETYRNLYLQLGAPYSKDKINAALLNHTESTKLLYHYFQSKFSIDPQFGQPDYRKEVLLPEVQRQFLESLQKVDEVADDTILRRLFNLMEATLRTNFYIPKQNKDTFISIKLDSRLSKQMPTPAPYREIYVHDVGMEGTHLRFGPISRGGLRWSDRPDDFRKEVLGLVKTQQTKNVVIVPVGSKGGFIIKKPLLTKEDAATESVTQYRKFIAGLLDITDNIDSNGNIKHPSYIIAYDGPDPYLVVAADKGTASFSDIANDMAEKYNFWLGDAFASGGSIGYNHKKEAITARGGWECVKLHFLELGKNIETETFTVAGIGDMSGDVFGNGMLLSKNIKLQAAFNHIHIFIDP
ncbi:NAD-glutamate dehydrogenase, partial [bacterium]|nr:NAD-glutamate dehydrogenase [bacterium]